MRISDWSSDVCSSDLIDRQQILARVRTAKPAEARVGGGRGIDRKQLQNAAAERIEDMRNLARQIPELSGRRDHCVTELFEPGELSRSAEHTSELQSLMRISYAVFCLQKKIKFKYINRLP